MKKNNRFVSWIKSSASDVWLFIIAVVLLNMVAARCFFRADLTQAKSYSLSSASREVVGNLEEPMSIKVFFSKKSFSCDADLLSSISSIEDTCSSGTSSISS